MADIYQKNIFGDEEKVTLPYQPHSETSADAAKSMEPNAKTLRAKVLATLRNWGPLTDEEIADITGLNPSTARPRRIELERDGLIRKAGVQKNKSGRNATVWAANSGLDHQEQ